MSSSITGVECRNVANGFTCGPCPPGLTGNGKREGCRPARQTCANSPCFPGVDCVDTAFGFQCDPCPPGEYSSPS